MLLRKKQLVVPEYVQANREGALDPRQRRGYLLNTAMLATGVALLLGTCLIMFFAGKVNFMMLICLGAAALVGMSLQEPWQIYREQNPKIVSFSGPLKPIPNSNIRRGGFVALGDKRVYLSRLQLKEVQFGRYYEMFLVLPQNTVLSAQTLD